MKITITGAAGYIGSMLTSKLLEQGHTVYAFDNFYFNQQELTQHIFKHKNCIFYSLKKG